MTNKRKKIWIDRFQTLLFLRIAAYFLLYQAAVWMLVGIGDSMYAALESTLGRRAVTFCFALMVGGVVLLGLVFTWDAMRFAHRIVGPLYRFRQTVRAITAAEELELLNLRKGDFLQEFKDEFNEMLRALEQRGAVALRMAETRQDQGEPVSV